MLPRIFVRVACYRDEECNATLRDLFRKAEHPSRVFVGVCWQYLPGFERQRPWFDVPGDQLRVTTISAARSRGVCWARRHTELLHRGEEFTLQVDSHSRFATHWDSQLVAELGACDSEKALLSSMPAAYTLPDELEPHPRVSVCCAKDFDAQGNLRFFGRVILGPVAHPVPGAFVAGGFMFAGSGVLAQVPYDPHLYYDQEEASYAVRLYTHGWDVFSPRRAFVYHLYDRPGRHDHWADHRNWGKLARNGLRRFEHLTGYRRSRDREVIAELGRYALGRTRSLESYEAFSGVDFRRKRIDERARQGLPSHDDAGLERRARPACPPLASEVRNGG